MAEQRHGDLPTGENTVLRDTSDAEIHAAGLTVALQARDNQEVVMILDQLGIAGDLRRIRRT